MEAQELIKRLDSALERARTGEYSWALQEFESLERLSQHPQDIAALRFFQATCLTDMGRAEEALKQISRVDRSKLIFSSQVDYEYEYARIERALGHTREALDRAERALNMAERVDNKQELTVVSRNLRTMRGILLAESGRCDEAIPALQAVPMEDEGWAEARVHLGDCKYKNKLYQEAIDYYLSITSTTKKVHPFYRDAALRNIGYAFYDLRQYAKAVEYLAQVEHAYDENLDLKAELFGILASSYSRLGLPLEAAKYGGFSKGTNSVQ
jgi:tetratricopeptide (TPR) repeat protein